jgi:hypothetical protein
MKHLWLIVLLAGVSLSGEAAAQIAPLGSAPGPSPLGITSPLGTGPQAPVAPVGIPLGATELSNLGVSPTPSGVPSTGPVTSSAPFCAGFGSSIPQASLGSTIAIPGQPAANSTFDGGGITGNASGTCGVGGATNLALPSASASSPTGMGPAPRVGQVGIPMGATELGAGGISPPPTDPIINAPMSNMPMSSTGSGFSPSMPGSGN